MLFIISWDFLVLVWMSVCIMWFCVCRLCLVIRGWLWLLFLEGGGLLIGRCLFCGESVLFFCVIWFFCGWVVCWICFLWRCFFFCVLLECLVWMRM